MTNANPAYDTIVLGSSINALTVATYLARAGQRVLVLEPAQQLGGALATREFADGFHADLSLMSGRLDNQIIHELQLHQQGLEIINRNTITSLLPDGANFSLVPDPTLAAANIAEFARNDAARYGEFHQLLELAVDLKRTIYSLTPPQLPHPSTHDAAQLMSLVGQLRGYGRREMTEVIRLLVMSARDFLNEWFENDHLKGLLGSLAVRGLTQGPFAGGTTFNLIHHLTIGDGYFRASVRGGISGLIGILAKVAEQHGAELRINTGSFRVSINNGLANGVVLANGEQIIASQVISDYDARYTFTRLVDPPELTPEFNRLVQQVRYNGAVARVNLAVRELPDFNSTGINLTEEVLKGTLVLAPSVAYLERAYDCAKYGELSHQPYLEVTIPSLTDNTLAPAGAQVISIWLQYAPYRGRVNGDQIRELVLSQLSEFAPNLRSLVTAAQVITPHDFEKEFNLSEGHLYGGDMTLSQTFFLRPIPGYGQYQTPIEQLYMCGAATHPGGGISGLAGRNLAQRLLNKE